MPSHVIPPCEFYDAMGQALRAWCPVGSGGVSEGGGTDHSAAWLEKATAIGVDGLGRCLAASVATFTPEAGVLDFGPDIDPASLKEMGTFDVDGISAAIAEEAGIPAGMAAAFFGYLFVDVLKAPCHRAAFLLLPLEVRQDWSNRWAAATAAAWVAGWYPELSGRPALAAVVLSGGWRVLGVAIGYAMEVAGLSRAVHGGLGGPVAPHSLPPRSAGHVVSVVDDSASIRDYFARLITLHRRAPFSEDKVNLIVDFAAAVVVEEFTGDRWSWCFSAAHKPEVLLSLGSPDAGDTAPNQIARADSHGDMKPVADAPAEAAPQDGDGPRGVADKGSVDVAPVGVSGDGKDGAQAAEPLRDATGETLADGGSGDLQAPDPQADAPGDATDTGPATCPASEDDPLSALALGGMVPLEDLRTRVSELLDDGVKSEGASSANKAGTPEPFVHYSIEDCPEVPAQGVADTASEDVGSSSGDDVAPSVGVEGGSPASTIDDAPVTDANVSGAIASEPVGADKPVDDAASDDHGSCETPSADINKAAVPSLLATESSFPKGLSFERLIALTGAEGIVPVPFEASDSTEAPGSHEVSGAVSSGDGSEQPKIEGDISTTSKSAPPSPPSDHAPEGDAPSVVVANVPDDDRVGSDQDGTPPSEALAEASSDGGGDVLETVDAPAAAASDTSVDQSPTVSDYQLPVPRRAVRPGILGSDLRQMAALRPTVRAKPTVGLNQL